MADYRDNYTRCYDERSRSRSGVRQGTSAPSDQHFYDKSSYRARNRDEAYASRSNGQYQVRDRKAATRSRSARHTAQHSMRDGSASADCCSVQSRSNRPSRLIIVILIVVIALAVFGIVRCVGSLGSDSGSDGSTNQIVGESQSAVEGSEYLPTPFIAQGDGVTLHSAVRADQLTEILIHNASYSYACALTTQLTEATNVDVMAAHGTGRVASEQPTGDNWLTGEFIRCYRDGNAGPKMSAIDCGGAVGATVYAPVSGTVVKVKKYKLYNEYPDIQIHIQPDGRSDLDVVLIHLENAQVQEGDQVIGGVTPIAQIRDVYAYIGEEMQLKQYTAEGDNGNHTHIQINDATNKDYHGLDD